MESNEGFLAAFGDDTGEVAPDFGEVRERIESQEDVADQVLATSTRSAERQSLVVGQQERVLREVAGSHFGDTPPSAGVAPRGLEQIRQSRAEAGFVRAGESLQPGNDSQRDRVIGIQLAGATNLENPNATRQSSQSRIEPTSQRMPDYQGSDPTEGEKELFGTLPSATYKGQAKRLEEIFDRRPDLTQEQGVEELKREIEEQNDAASDRIASRFPPEQQARVSEYVKPRFEELAKKVNAIEALQDTNPEEYKQQKDALLAEIQAGIGPGALAENVYVGLLAERGVAAQSQAGSMFGEFITAHDGRYADQAKAAFASGDMNQVRALAQKIADETGDTSLLEQTKELEETFRNVEIVDRRIAAQERAKAMVAPIGPNSYSAQTQELFTQIDASGNNPEFVEALKANVIDQSDEGVFTSFLGVPVFIPYGDLNQVLIANKRPKAFNSEEFQRTVVDAETHLTITFPSKAEREAFVEGLLGNKQLESDRLLTQTDVEQITGIVRSLNLDTPNGKRLIREIGAYPLPQNEFKLSLVSLQLDLWGVGKGDGVGDPTTVDDVIKWYKHQEYMWKNGGKPFGSPTLFARRNELNFINADGSPKEESGADSVTV